MPRKKNKLSKEEILEKAKTARRIRYAKIKADPMLYALEKEKERQRYKARKEQKKVLPIGELTPKAKRVQRQKWRENFKKHYEKKKMEKKEVQHMNDNTPEISDEEDQPREDHVLNRYNENCQNDPQPPTLLSHKEKMVQLREKIRKLKYTLKKQTHKYKQETALLKQKNEAYRKMILRLKKRLQSPNTKAKILLKDKTRAEEAKKKILFAEAMKETLELNYKENTTKKGKRHFSDTLLSNQKIMKKYKVLSDTTNFRLRPKNVNKNDQKQNFEKIKMDLQCFFERDDISRATAGKKEFITKKKERKQKRYLNDNLKNLHKIYEDEYGKISYSYFCKNRPFWVLIPDVQDRDTCVCKIHANIMLLISALKKRKIIKESNPNDLINSLCCPKLECLIKRCGACKDKVVSYQEFDNNDSIAYKKWENKMSTYITKGKEQQKRIIAKITLTKLPTEAIRDLEQMIPIFLKHEGIRRWQFHAIKELKQNLKETEAIIHIDFSENYAMKYESEVQSFHFGGSRQELTLHTAVIYYRDSTNTVTSKSFCTVSESKRHDSAAVWAHIVPLLEFVETVNKDIDNLHFLSDSPSSQYRNKTMFYAIAKMYWYFHRLKLITWNYFESAHGKGAADGVGAVLKRTADAAVAQGKDVASMDAFLDVVTKNTQNIKIVTVHEYEIAEKDLLIPSDKLLLLQGTMKVHQVLWQKESVLLIFREASCFICLNSDCTHTKFVGELCYRDEIDNKENESDKGETNKQNNTRSKYKTADGVNKDNINSNVPRKKKSENIKMATTTTSTELDQDKELDPNKTFDLDDSTKIKGISKVKVISNVLLKKITNENNVTLLSDIKPDNKNHLEPKIIDRSCKLTSDKASNIKILSKKLLKKKFQDECNVTMLCDLKQDDRIKNTIKEYNLSGSDNINLSGNSSFQSNVNDITDLFGDPQSSNAACAILNPPSNPESDANSDSDYDIF